jgi:hypothetical protein
MYRTQPTQTHRGETAMIINDQPNKLNLNGYLRMSCIVLLGGGAIGFIGYLVAKVIFLIYIFPFLMGLAGGILLDAQNRKAKIHTQKAAIFFGVLMGLAIYLGLRFPSYLQFRSNSRNAFREDILAEGNDPQDYNLDGIVDRALVHETGLTGFLGYLIYRSQTGVTLTTISTGANTNLDPFATWMYWLFELGLMTVLPIIMLRKSASRSFCEQCNEWRSKPKHLGGVSLGRYEEILGLVKSQDFEHLGEVLSEDTDLPSIEVYLDACENCVSASTYLILTRFAWGGRSILEKTLYREIIAPAQKSALQQGFARRKTLIQPGLEPAA